MKIKALVSFAGALSMAKGEIRDAADERLAASLITCGYAERVIENEQREAERSDVRKRKKTSEN